MYGRCLYGSVPIQAASLIHSAAQPPVTAFMLSRSSAFYFWASDLIARLLFLIFGVCLIRPFLLYVLSLICTSVPLDSSSPRKIQGIPHTTCCPQRAVYRPPSVTGSVPHCANRQAVIHAIHAIHPTASRRIPARRYRGRPLLGVLRLIRGCMNCEPLVYGSRMQ